jgi:hypothetical protein
VTPAPENAVAVKAASNDLSYVLLRLNDLYVAAQGASRLPLHDAEQPEKLLRMQSLRVRTLSTPPT